ncbi:MAG: alkaline phosphatase family protein, partial [Chloroflexota bacterium]|nr:alkaline phosphatase family protein [Chloroflexota bacterium]
MRGVFKHQGKRYSRFVAFLLIALAVAMSIGPFTGYSQAAPQGATPVASKELIFVSDGMRPDLVEKYARSGEMPNYAKVINGGVTGDNGMVPQFPPNTGAGWSSISTGAWAGTHGGINNTFHIDSNAVTTSTSAFSASLIQAETYGEVAEKAGKKVAILDWPGTLPGTNVKGPAVDFRNFYSSRGVVANYDVPGVLPNFVRDFGLVYTNGLQINDAAGWTGMPQSFSPAKETSFSFRTNTISNTAATLNWPVYIYDSTNDGQVNYDKVFITHELKNVSQAIADLKVGQWKDVKTSLPQNNLLVGFYIKLIDLTPDLSKFRLYFSSLARTRSNMPDLEQKIALEYPSATGADFAPLEAGIIDAQTYVEQGLMWYDMYRQVHDYVIKTFNPDVVMAGYPVTDEFSHQFMALWSPGYNGPRPAYGDPTVAENYNKQAYIQADTMLGHLMELMGPDTVLFLGADHGFSPAWRSVNLLQVLQDAGLYNPANRGASKAIGYAAGGTANIYINLKGREQGGVVETSDYESVREQILDVFNSLNDGGVSVTGAVWNKEETRAIKADGYIINAWHPTRTGDVVVVLKPPYQWDAPTTGTRIADSPFYGQHGYLPDVVDLSKNINMHSMFGIFGPGIAQAKKLTKPRAIDLIPTAAYAINIPVPRHAEGRVLTEAFAGTNPNLKPIQVLAWGDYHGQLDPVQVRVDNLNVPSGGVANIGAYWNEAKAKNPGGTIILSDGDNVGATPPNSSFLNDVPIIQAMNLLGFTASALGNHEFDKGVTGLQALQSVAKFPYLADNILDARTGQVAGFTKPYIVVKANGIDVGIIGVGNPETPTVTKPTGIQGLQFADPIAQTNKYVQELVGKGIKTIIVVYHQGSLGGDFDHPTGIFADFARGVDPEVDLIVGGHTRIETMARVNGKLVSEANHAVSTTEITLLVDPQTNNVDWSWGAFRRPYGGAIAPDPALAALVKETNEQIKPVLSEQVGTAATLVDRSRTAESKMGNLVSDSIRATYQVDVALQNSGGLRADFQQGPITKGDVFTVLPFGNVVVTGQLKGSDLLGALENGVSGQPAGSLGIVLVSVELVGYDLSRTVGQRVLWAV